MRTAQKSNKLNALWTFINFERKIKWQMYEIRSIWLKFRTGFEFLVKILLNQSIRNSLINKIVF